MSLKQIFTEEQANYIIDKFGECWLNSDSTIEYLAPIIDPQDRSGNSYLIEKGTKIENVIKTELVALSDIPLECIIDDMAAMKYKFSEKISNQINVDKKIPVTERLVGVIQPQNLKSLKVRPILAGCEITALEAADRSGTIGAFLRMTPFTDADGSQVYFITNYHVVVAIKYKENDLVFQPNNNCYDYSNFIGNVLCGQYYDNDGKSEYTHDVAFVKLDPRKLKKDPMFTQDCIIGTGFIDNKKILTRTSTRIQGMAEPRIGMKVRLHGISTVVSEKVEIRSINAIVRVGNLYKSIKESPYFGKETLLFKKQILTDNISQPGDSGSILINSDGIAVGLHHAGDDHNVSVSNNLCDIFKNNYEHTQGELQLGLIEFLT